MTIMIVGSGKISKLHIDKNENLPLYYKALTDLLERIEKNEYPPSSMLKPEIELARDYGISRNTMRHAIELLVRDGFLKRIPGKGTFVISRREDLTREQWIVPAIEDVLEASKQTRVDFKPMVILDMPPAFVIEDLNLKKWNKACYYEGIKRRTGDKINRLEVYVPYEIGIQIDVEKRGQKTNLAYLQENMGIDITQVDQYTGVDVFTNEDNKIMKGRVGDPKLVIKRIYYNHEQPVSVTVNHYAKVNGYIIFSRVYKKSAKT